MKTDYPTQTILSTGRRFSWPCVVLLAVALQAAPPARAATDAANVAALRSNLPASMTLTRASIKQTCEALHEAVKQHHDDAVDLLRIAVLAKTPKQGDGKLACDDLQKLLHAACTAAPDRTPQLVEMAASLDPDCADSLQDFVAHGGALGEAGDAGEAGIGSGLGAGFPGSPGFTGSAPSGATALPPIALPSPGAPPVTSVTNN